MFANETWYKPMYWTWTEGKGYFSVIMVNVNMLYLTPLHKLTDLQNPYQVEAAVPNPC
jgi:hypothetical protein